MAPAPSDCSDLNASPHADFVDGYLRMMLALPFVQRYKQASFDALALAPGCAVLEVGCGTGHDAAALAERVAPGGSVAAVDKSAAMLAGCRRAFGNRDDVTFHEADATDLPFADGRFDAARVDRTLQHVPDPEAALAEMARVVRPGGTLVAIEPDWDTLVLDSVHPELTDHIQRRLKGGMRQPGMGRRLWGSFTALGLADLAVTPWTLVLTDLAHADEVFILQTTARAAVDAGEITEAEAAEWYAGLQARHGTGHCFAALTLFMVRGKVGGRDFGRRRFTTDAVQHDG